MPSDRTDTWDAYLGPGETLLWAGGPEPDTRLRWGQIGMAIFGAPFLLFGIGFIGITLWSMLAGQASEAWQWGVALFFVAFGLAFAAVGVSMVVWPHLSARLRPRYERYAVGTQRAYIARSWWRPSIKSYAIRPDANVELIRGGLDIVVFQVGTVSDSDGARHEVTARFMALADGMHVYRLIRQVQSDIAAAAPPHG